MFYGCVVSFSLLVEVRIKYKFRKESGGDRFYR